MAYHYVSGVSIATGSSGTGATISNSTGFNGGSVEHTMRAAVQHQREVGYVFAGSERSLMERMIGPRRPFYKAGPVMRLDKIPPDERKIATPETGKILVDFKITGVVDQIRKLTATTDSRQ